VPVTNAIAGIGLAGQKQMVTVRHHVERQAKLGMGGARNPEKARFVDHDHREWGM
jgi:hypothetical protein